MLPFSYLFSATFATGNNTLPISTSAGPVWNTGPVLDSDGEPIVEAPIKYRPAFDDRYTIHVTVDVPAMFQGYFDSVYTSQPIENWDLACRCALTSAIACGLDRVCSDYCIPAQLHGLWVEDLVNAIQ